LTLILKKQDQKIAAFGSSYGAGRVIDQTHNRRTDLPIFCTIAKGFYS